MIDFINKKYKPKVKFGKRKHGMNEINQSIKSDPIVHYCS